MKYMRKNLKKIQLVNYYSMYYALFEDEFYLQSQIAVLKETLELFIEKYNSKARSGTVTE